MLNRKGILIIALFILMMAGCSSTSALNEVATAIQSTNQPSLDAVAEIDRQIELQRATTRPDDGRVVSDESIKREAENEKILTRAKLRIEQARQAGQAILPVILAAANGDNPGAAITGAAPTAGPYSTWVALAGIVVSLGWGVWNNIQKGKALKAGQANIDAINSAIADGHAAILTTSAASKIDSMVMDHPLGDRLVDAIAAATVSKGGK